jgi:two-component system phosphate regulon sensor histidine kinase PhoR
MPHSQELSRLAGAMNTMAGQLDERIKTIIAQRNQLDAVLSGMSEAVVAFDLDERILFLNSAAEKLFNVQPLTVQGRTVTESIRSSQFQQFVQRLIETRETQTGDITAGPDREKRLEVRGNLLHDESGTIIGGIIVLNDVTELRRLENIRKDFVANVSHELRTPITSIKGFVETLLNNALDDKQNTKRFLEIVQRHADRLSMIIEDLLSLSRIEQQADSEQIQTELTKISQIIDSAMHLCEQNAISKQIKVERSCREELRGHVAPSLLEQALVNLIDNAIKYSEEQSTIKVEAFETDQEIVLAVHDNGCGISREHLDRLFERFYRIDKARSRKVGGTGLGLSIVKHIAQAMGGYPTVSSTVGKGSTFEIHLPRFSAEERTA